MTAVVRITLLGDGSSDRCLLVILRRLVGDILGTVAIESHWADLRQVDPLPTGLVERMRAAVREYPCDVLFVHRDAERQPWEDRVREINEAAGRVAALRHVCVVPIRMTEAWLLGDEIAIRHAADNPNGTTDLGLPAPRSFESLPDPKAALRAALVAASNKQGRRLRRFQETIGERVQRVAELMTRFEGLYSLSAFVRLKEEAKLALADLGASVGPRNVEESEPDA